MDDLAAWLDQVLKADQAAAQAVVDRYAPDEATIYLEDPYPEEAAFLPTVTPARTLARIASDRQILAAYVALRDAPERMTDVRSDSWWRALDAVVRLLALPHADRPGYQEAWRP